MRSGGGRGGITEVLIYPISMSRTHTYPSPSALFIADVNEMNVFADCVHDFSYTEKETIRSRTNYVPNVTNEEGLRTFVGLLILSFVNRRRRARCCCYFVTQGGKITDSSPYIKFPPSKCLISKR